MQSVQSMGSPKSVVGSLPQKLVSELPAPVCVRNTFIELQMGRDPSLDGFYMERQVRSAPCSGMNTQLPPPTLPNGLLTAAALQAAAERHASAVVSLAERLPLQATPGFEKPQPVGSPPLVSATGNAGHISGTCRPCAFVWKEKGCSSGDNCDFCHLCEPGEKKKRQKEKRRYWTGLNRMCEALMEGMNFAGAADSKAGSDSPMMVPNSLYA